MDVARIQTLEAASRKKSFDPDTEVPWGIPFDESPPALLPDEVMSLYGTPEFDHLSSIEKARLSLHETAAIFSAFVRFEGVLNQALARKVRSGDPVGEVTSYTLRVIEEEARHSRMFSRLIEEIGVGGYGLDGLYGAVERLGEALIARGDMHYFLGMLAVEEITDTLLARILAGGTKHPVLSAVCTIHRIEEARHMDFARMAVAERFEDASLASRVVVKRSAPFIFALIFEVMFPPSIYLRSGIADSKREARQLWRKSRASPQRRQLREDCVSRLVPFLHEIGMVDQFEGRAWRVTGFGS